MLRDPTPVGAGLLSAPFILLSLAGVATFSLNDYISSYLFLSDGPLCSFPLRYCVVRFRDGNEPVMMIFIVLYCTREICGHCSACYAHTYGLNVSPL